MKPTHTAMQATPKLKKNFSIASVLSSRRGSKMLFSLMRATSMTGHTSTAVLAQTPWTKNQSPGRTEPGTKGYD